MKNWDFTLGVDVSKNTLDISCSELNEHIKITNGTEGFVLFLKWCRSFKIDLKKSFLVMEYTGFHWLPSGGKYDPSRKSIPHVFRNSGTDDAKPGKWFCSGF